MDVYRTWSFPSVFYYLTLQFIPRAWRGLLFGLAGVAAVTIAVLQLNRSLLSAFRAPGQSSLADIIYNHRQRGRRLRVAGIGGGTGLSALLRGLKEHTGNITAIVTVVDGGGSSGRLRRGPGLLPPGTFPLWRTSLHRQTCVPVATVVLPKDVREAPVFSFGASQVVCHVKEERNEFAKDCSD